MTKIPMFGAAAGQWLKIFSLPEGQLRSQFIRFGIYEGERVLCLERLPGGTIVIQKHRQQITIGSRLARQILVLILNSPEEV
jgi:ferrous iron transport protein A